MPLLESLSFYHFIYGLKWGRVSKNLTNLAMVEFPPSLTLALPSICEFYFFRDGKFGITRKLRFMDRKNVGLLLATTEFYFYLLPCPAKDEFRSCLQIPIIAKCIVWKLKEKRYRFVCCLC